MFPSRPSCVGVYPHTNDPPSSQKSSEMPDTYPRDLICDDRTGPVNTGLGCLPNGMDLDDMEKALGTPSLSPDETCNDRCVNESTYVTYSFPLLMGPTSYLLFE